MKKINNEAAHKMALEAIKIVEHLLVRIEKERATPLEQLALLQVFRKDCLTKMTSASPVARLINGKLVELLDIVIREIPHET